VVRSDPQTGKLVRSVVVTPKVVAQRTVSETVIAPRVVTSDAPAAAPAQAAGIEQTVESIAAQHALPAELLHSVIKVESNYNPYAVSSKGALGMMQLIPATARRFGVQNVFNPTQNIQGGARYLRYLLDLYNGNYPLALAAYNAGEGAVAKYGGVPPYKETKNYLVSVKKHLDKAAGAKQTPPPAVRQEPAPRDPNAPAHIQQIVETDGTVRYVSR
jgi:soluble lytic murein transglycosylase-like protein